MATTVLPPVASAAEWGFLAEGDDLCAKDAVKFLHDIDNYSFDDSVDYCVDYITATPGCLMRIKKIYVHEKVSMRKVEKTSCDLL